MVYCNEVGVECDLGVNALLIVNSDLLGNYSVDITNAYLTVMENFQKNYKHNLLFYFLTPSNLSYLLSFVLFYCL